MITSSTGPHIQNGFNNPITSKKQMVNLTQTISRKSTFDLAEEHYNMEEEIPITQCLKGFKPALVTVRYIMFLRSLVVRFWKKIQKMYEHGSCH